MFKLAISNIPTFDLMNEIKYLFKNTSQQSKKQIDCVDGNFNRDGIFTEIDFDAEPKLQTMRARIRCATKPSNCPQYLPYNRCYKIPAIMSNRDKILRDYNKMNIITIDYMEQLYEKMACKNTKIEVNPSHRVKKKYNNHHKTRSNDKCSIQLEEVDFKILKIDEPTDIACKQFSDVLYEDDVPILVDNLNDFEVLDIKGANKMAEFDTSLKKPSMVVDFANENTDELYEFVGNSLEAPIIYQNDVIKTRTPPAHTITNNCHIKDGIKQTKPGMIDLLGKKFGNMFKRPGIHKRDIKSTNIAQAAHGLVDSAENFNITNLNSMSKNVNIASDESGINNPTTSDDCIKDMDDVLGNIMSPPDKITKEYSCNKQTFGHHQKPIDVSLFDTVNIHDESFELGNNILLDADENKGICVQNLSSIKKKVFPHGLGSKIISMMGLSKKSTSNYFGFNSCGHAKRALIGSSPSVAIAIALPRYVKKNQQPFDSIDEIDGNITIPEVGDSRLQVTRSVRRNKNQIHHNINITDNCERMGNTSCNRRRHKSIQQLSDIDFEKSHEAGLATIRRSRLRCAPRYNLSPRRVPNNGTGRGGVKTDTTSGDSYSYEKDFGLEIDDNILAKIDSCRELLNSLITDDNDDGEEMIAATSTAINDVTMDLLRDEIGDDEKTQKIIDRIDAVLDAIRGMLLCCVVCHKTAGNISMEDGKPMTPNKN